jgi:CheY-like chemotaxis protein
MQPARLLVIGTIDEFSRDAISQLDGRLRSVRLVHAMDDALAWLRASEALPDLIVVGQQHPSQFTIAVWQELLRAAPLVPLWRLLGTWCEGEQRSGRPPGGCLSDYWHSFSPRLARALVERAAGCRPRWAAPPTASAEERMLAESALALPKSAGQVVVCADRRANAMALADACRLAGYKVTPARPGNLTGQSLLDRESECVCALLWDATPQQICDRVAVNRVRAAFASAPVLAIVDFPRPEDVCQARSLGIDHVFSKPYSNRDLLDRIVALQEARPV